MNCRKVEQILSSYLDNELTIQSKKSVDEHLEACSFCRDLVDSIRGVDMLVQEQKPSVPEEYWANFVPRLHKKIVSEGVRRRDPLIFLTSHIFRLALGFALLMVVIVAAVIPVRQLAIHKLKKDVVTTPVVYITMSDKNALAKNYLTQSEMILINIIAMPEQKENLELLKGQINRSGLIEQIDTNMELFNDNPELLSHSKAMEMITIKVLSTEGGNCQENIKILRSEVEKSGLLEKTQSMKI